MSNMSRRLKKIEKALMVGKEEQVVAQIVMYGGILPPDHTDGNITTQYVAYEDIEKDECQEQAKTD